MISVDTLIVFFVLVAGIGSVVILAFDMLWQAGFHPIPLRMKLIYQQVREKLHSAGWG